MVATCAIEAGGVLIPGSYNVASLTYTLGVGWRITFLNALPNTKYWVTIIEGGAVMAFAKTQNTETLDITRASDLLANARAFIEVYQ